VTLIEAAVLRERDGSLRVETLELPPPGPGRVRVKLAAAGVCHSDLSLANGTLRQQFPVVLGHEGAGTVIALGADVTGLAIGDPVVLNWSPSCGLCWFCLAGEPYLCEHSADGSVTPYATVGGIPVYAGLGTAAFATETVVGANACIKLPADVPLKEAALLGCAVLTGVGAVTNSARVQPGQSVVIIGLGGVGLAALQGARIAGASVIVAVDPAEGKHELAKKLGATHTLTPSDTLAKEIRALTGGRGADHAIECVGRSATIRSAYSVVRRGGRATIVGLGAITDTFTLNALEVAYFAKTLAGCMYGSSNPAVDVPKLLELHRSGRLDLRSLVSEQRPLSEVDDAFADLRSGTAARTLITFD
jgi:S-(hydroxymethyl)glutathione dehydrogenase / alcohol dehydrogenase